MFERGPGMGYFTLELAWLVGASWRVLAVDIQPKMLERLSRRVSKAGLLERIDTHLATAESMGIAEFAGSVDFTLAFAVVHELPDTSRFFREVSAVSKPVATLLLAEPKGHVKESTFQRELELAAQAGFELTGRPAIKGSHTAVLKKESSPDVTVGNAQSRPESSRKQ